MKKDKLSLNSLKIEGKRIILRPLISTDAESLFLLVDRSRKELGKWLPWVKENTEVIHTKEFIRHTAKVRRDGETLSFGIFLKFPETIIGTIDARRLKTGIAEIGYWLGTEFTDKGFVSEATTLLGDFLFKNIPIHKIEIRCEPKNLKSRAIPRRLGFKKEGQLRNAACGHEPGIYRDLIVYGMLNDEWKSAGSARDKSIYDIKNRRK